MRELLASGSERAKLAIDFYTYRIAQDVGKLAVVLGGLDGLVFTGGIGEHAAPIRAQVCERLAPLFGIALDAQLNEAGSRDGHERVSTRDSRVPVFAIRTDEEGMIALHTARLLREALKR